MLLDVADSASPVDVGHAFLANAAEIGDAVRELDHDVSPPAIVYQR